MKKQICRISRVYPDGMFCLLNFHIYQKIGLRDIYLPKKCYTNKAIFTSEEKNNKKSYKQSNMCCILYRISFSVNKLIKNKIIFIKNQTVAYNTNFQLIKFNIAFFIYYIGFCE